MPGEPGGDRSGEARGVHIARGDVDGDRHLQAHRAPARHLGERGLQDVLGQPRHQPGGLGDGDELVRWHPAAVRMHPADQRLQPGDMAVEADLGLVVQLDVAGVQGAAQIAEQAEPVGGVAVPLGLVELDAAAVPLGLVHGDVGAAQQPFGVEGVVGEDGDPRAGFEHEGQSVEVQRGAEGGDEIAGHPLGAGERSRWWAAGRRTRHRRAGPPRRRAGRACRSRSAIWSSRRSPARWPRVSLTERKRSRSMRTSAERAPTRSASSSAVQVRSSSHWRLGRPVSGSRSCSSARARAIHRVESSAMSGTANSGSSSGCVDGADGDQRGDAQQRDADECLAEYGRSGDGGQAGRCAG